MHQFVYSHGMYAIVFFLNVWKQIAKYQFKKSPKILTCVLDNEQSGAYSADNDSTHVQALIPEDDVLPKHCTVDHCKQEEHARASIYDWAMVILELYNSDKERHLKGIVALLHAENFGLNGIQETLNVVRVYRQFVHETGNKYFQEMDFEN